MHDPVPTRALKAARGFVAGGLLAFLGPVLVSSLFPLPSGVLSGFALVANGLVGGGTIGGTRSAAVFGGAFLVIGTWCGFGLTPVGVFFRDWFLGFALVGGMGAAARSLESPESGWRCFWRSTTSGMLGFAGGVLFTGLLGWIQYELYPELNRQVVLLLAYVLPQVIGGAVLAGATEEVGTAHARAGLVRRFGRVRSFFPGKARNGPLS